MAYLLTGTDELLNGTLRATGHIAKGGVRVSARQLSPSKVVVELAMPSGWHVNSNVARQKSLIATTLKVGARPKGWRLRQVSYPPAEVLALGFQREPLSLYRGTVEVVVELDKVGMSSRMLELELRAQACNDKVCLPPWESVQLHFPMEAGF